MCSINVCGLNSKLKYKIIEDYIRKFDIACLTETKCDIIAEKEIVGYKSFVMNRKIKKHKYGGIHGICILIKENISCHFSMINSLLSESILWVHVSPVVLGYEFILGAVYLPYEQSVYFHDDIYDQLADDIITIKAKNNVPIILLGDFNSRVGTATDFEQEFKHDGLNLETDPHHLYFEENNLIFRANKDIQVNNNGKKLIDLCKMSDLKITNGRIGRDKSHGDYTCYTSQGKSAIDFGVVSMELFPHIIDFYIDVFDKCISDVHCPICLVLSSDRNVSCERVDTSIDSNNSDFIVKNNTRCKWNDKLSNEYILSFNIDQINNLNVQLKNTLSSMSHVTHDIIDSLYVEMKNIFIQPAKSTGMCKEIKHGGKQNVKNTRRHGKHTWFNDECEISRKKCMSLKNPLKLNNTSEQQHQLFHDHVKRYKKLVSNTKRLYLKKFHIEIRNLKTHNPKEFWKFIQTEPMHNSTGCHSIMFQAFVKHFQELSCDPTLSGIVSPMHDASTAQSNDAINQPFTIAEVKLAIRQLKNCKASGVDNIINGFFKHCHNDCYQLTYC